MVALKLVALVLLVVLAVGALSELSRQCYHPMFHHREDIAPWLRWHKNPTPENETSYREVHARWRRDNCIYEAALYTIPALDVVGIVVLVRKPRTHGRT